MPCAWDNKIQLLIECLSSKQDPYEITDDFGQPYESAQKGMFVETVSQDSLSPLGQHFQEGEMCSPLQLQQFPHSQDPYSEPIKGRSQLFFFFPWQSPQFPWERGGLSLCALIHTALSLEGQTLVSFLPSVSLGCLRNLTY